MAFYRINESHFDNLNNYPFKPHYTDIEGLRIHYIDEGPRASKPVLLLHGVPTWSYLYRDIIPLLAEAGYRVIAPDLAGFGRSDKPVDHSWYSLSSHVRILCQLVATLDLSDITLFGQDWGSMIGLRMAVEVPERFGRIIISNGGLPTGKEEVPLLFTVWRLFARWSPYFPIDRIINSGCRTRLSKEQRRAYKAPFPGPKDKVGPRVMPRKVPLSTKHPEAAKNMAAWEKLESWHKPFLSVFGDSDPITRAWNEILRERIPGAKKQEHKVLKAGHFIQEDAGPELAEIIIKFAGQRS